MLAGDVVIPAWIPACALLILSLAPNALLSATTGESFAKTPSFPSLCLSLYRSINVSSVSFSMSKYKNRARFRVLTGALAVGGRRCRQFANLAIKMTTGRAVDRADRL